MGFKQGITVYFISAKAFGGQMVSKAINADGQEVGRSKVDVEFEADDAQYVTFAFGSEMDSQLVDKYLVDVRAQPKADSGTENSDSPIAVEGQ